MKHAGLHLATCLLLLGVVLDVARAEDEAQAEVWRFTDGSVERSVDVTPYPDELREVIVERLAAQGFRRVSSPAGTAEPRDLTADARELVRHGGRFPDASPTAADARDAAGLDDATVRAAARGVGRLIRELLAAEPRSRQAYVTRNVLRHLAWTLREAGAEDKVSIAERGRRFWEFWAGRAAEGPAEDRVILHDLLRAAREEMGPAWAHLPVPELASRPSPSRVAQPLGARAVQEWGPEDGDVEAWRLTEVPPSSVAATLGLAAGDWILRADGRPATRRALNRWHTVPRDGGKLTLRLQRKDGRTETWSVQVAPAR